MNHNEFIKLYNANRLYISVDKTLAQHIIFLLPRMYIFVCYFWILLFFFSIATLGILAICANVWYLVGVVIISPILFYLMMKAPQQVVFYYALKNEAFFNYATETNLIRSIMIK